MFKNYLCSMSSFIAVLLFVILFHSSVNGQARVSSKLFPLIYSKDNIEAYQTGMFSYSYSKSFNALDLKGNGQKALITASSNPASDTFAVSFLSPSGFTPVWEIKNAGFTGKHITSYAAAAQMTGTNEPEFIIWRSEEGRPEDSLYFQIFTKLSQKPLFAAKAMNDEYLVPTNLIDNAVPANDLTGDGLLEFCNVSTDITSQTATITIYNNLKPVSTLKLPYKSLLFTVAFSNDINSDGRPEIVFSDDMDMSFYQWDPSKNDFVKLATINPADALYSVAVNVDNDPDKEIVVKSGENTVDIYSKTFQKKKTIALPEGASIANIILKNTNSSLNSEIILTASIANSDNGSSYVYDLSLKDQPVWSDTSFSVQGAFDFKNRGYAQLFGFSMNQFSTMLLDGMTGYKPIWEKKGKYISAAGPFIPSNYFSFGFLGGFMQLFNPDINPVDMDNNGTKDIVVSIADMNSMGTYAVLDADGNIKDTLLNLPDAEIVYSLAYDFNNNGKPEIVIGQSSLFGNTPDKTWIFEHGAAAGIKENETFSPAAYLLRQNYPNPFNPATTISYHLSEASMVEIKVFDILGREIATLVNSFKQAGDHTVEFDGSRQSSGVYLCRMRAGEYNVVQKMVLNK